MSTQVKNFFSGDFSTRYYNLLWLQLVILIGFRVSTLITTTKSYTTVPFFIQNELIIGFSIIEVILAILFIIKIPKKVQHQNKFLGILVIYIFFLVLYLEQFILPNSPYEMYSDDVLFIILQLLVFLILIFINRITFDVKNDTSLLTLILLLSFILMLIAKLIQDNFELYLVFTILSVLTIWIFLWFSIFSFVKIQFWIYRWKSLIPIILGIFFAFGMYMGMMKSLGSDLGKTVFNTIVDQAFSLFAVNHSFYGFNPEILMILVDLVTVYCFLFVLGSVLLFQRPHSKDIVLIAIIGITGLATYPLLAIIRFFALFEFVALNKKLNKIQK